MKKILFSGIIVALALATFSCGSGETSGFKKTNGGLYYKFYSENKDARQAEVGDVIEGYVTLIVDSIVRYQSNKPEKLFHISAETLFSGDINEGFVLLHEGDSVVFKVNMDSINKYQGGGAPTTKEKYATYGIKVTRLFSESELAIEMELEAERMKPVEDSLINNYLKEHKLNAKQTESGLYLVSVRSGSGATHAVGETVSINYIGKFLNGQIFDGNWESELKKEGINTEGRRFNPLSVTVGSGQVIPGFEEAIMMMKKGGRATVILPSSLAYGAQGNQVIPPYTPLVFEIEILK
ncbi:MAG: FKBP-type peptidyl-prolyl cis-trans isomerase [Bacteroidales bacterium]|jgi:FKBP-type peptidyl-prolyl cis-trans isomerase|nr:FKBP-type peptidyl-prolyl cis-trans isomerase [Bacteroidales bacterium]